MVLGYCTAERPRASDAGMPSVHYRRAPTRPPVHLATYGDANYRAVAKAFASHAIGLGYVSSATVYSEDDIAPLLPAKVLATNRTHCHDDANHNYGCSALFWLWKPVVLRAALGEVAPGSLLFYADGGLILNAAADAKRDWFAKLELLAKSDSPPIDAVRFVNKQRKFRFNRYWSRGDVIHSMVLRGVCEYAYCAEETKRCDADASRALGERAKYNNSCLASFLMGEQIMAGRVLVRKTDASAALVDAWAEVAVRAPEMFQTRPLGYWPKRTWSYPGARGQRQDQSVFSALMYNFGWAGSGGGWRAWSHKPQVKPHNPKASTCAPHGDLQCANACDRLELGRHEWLPACRRSCEGLDAGPRWTHPSCANATFAAALLAE
jgi:hypothetical protein